MVNRRREKLLNDKINKVKIKTKIKRKNKNVNLKIIDGITNNIGVTNRIEDTNLISIPSSNHPQSNMTKFSIPSTNHPQSNTKFKVRVRRSSDVMTLSTGCNERETTVPFQSTTKCIRPPDDSTNISSQDENETVDDDDTAEVPQ